VFNVETLIGIKKQNIMMDQAANPMVYFLTILEIRNIKTTFDPVCIPSQAHECRIRTGFFYT
jgi:hypothetical protein